MYSNRYCSCSFEPEIIKIGLSSHNMYSNNILSFQVFTTILNACAKKSGNLLNAPRIYWLKTNSFWNTTSDFLVFNQKKKKKFCSAGKVLNRRT